MGELTITGATLDLNQFVGKGRSDADTYTLDVKNAVFTFLPRSGAAPVVTKVFEGAKVDNQNPCISAKGEIRVRLEGLDAPELAYQPTLQKANGQPAFPKVRGKQFTDFNEKCPQELGEAARAALHAYLQGNPPVTSIDVEVRTSVGLPGDVFDTYGRFIGDVWAVMGTNKIHLGRWLVENGWAFPQYYVCTSAADIAAMDAAWGKGRVVPGSVGKQFDPIVPPLKLHAAYCPAIPLQPAQAKLTLPKLFRRQTVWWGGSQAGLWRCSFQEYLRKKGDKVMLKEEFLKYGRAARKCELADFVAANGTLTLEAERMVFSESDAELTDANGKFLNSWSPARSPAQGDWKQKLSDLEWVNTVAISDDGQRIVGGTFNFDYENSSKKEGVFGIYCHDSAGVSLWKDEDATAQGFWSGVFAVAISGDGSVAACGGWLDRTQARLRAYDAGSPNGTKLLDCSTITKRVNSVSLSQDGKILAAAADKIYVFQRSGNAYDPVETALDMNMDGSVKSVAVHPSGAWLVACDFSGQVLMATIASGKITGTYKWQALARPIDHTIENSVLAPIPLLCVAIAGDSDSFFVGGGDYVYAFTKTDMLTIPLAPPNRVPPLEIDTWDGNAPIGKSDGGAAENVRWLSCSKDGSLLAVVVNRNLGSEKRGLLLVYKNGAQTPDWTAPLPHYPNSVSTDGAGKKIAVALGYPENSPGLFCLFDDASNELWHADADKMNWPVAISASGTRVAGGSDDGHLYSFII